MLGLPGLLAIPKTQCILAGVRPVVTIAAPGNHLVELGHGDLIGRLESAALHIADPRVSEAHAMVSLRGSMLLLLALRGRFSVDGKTLTTVQLVPGMEIRLADGLTLQVREVVLPDSVLAIRVASIQQRVLSGVSSLFGAPTISLKPGFYPDALAYFWPGSNGLHVRRPGQPDGIMAAGDSAVIDDVSIDVVEMALKADGQYITSARGGVATPLEIVARYDTVHIFREDRPAFQLSGISARIVSELAAFNAPASWEMVASELWPEDAADIAAGGGAESRVRTKWDVNLSRLRKKLNAAGIRPDLVRSDGHGNVELSLERGDIVRDEA